MQNNITELTQRLLRALDNNYNVTDMPAVIEVISMLEKVSITKELLETTRLGKHINELRRNISNESLAKRAKELLKKWRSKVLSVPTPAAPIAPDTNGQLAPEPAAAKKRPSSSAAAKEHQQQAKRPRVNGVSEYDLSDNSNSSFKDALVPKNVILINSDSNSSLGDVKNEPVLEEQQPKKRGRKKGSRNHMNLLDEAESSFTSKMAVSRGNAKVKTTQELIEGLQNRSMQQPAAKNVENWNERAAKLTERVSLIDQKLNASANRVKKKKNPNRTSSVLESGSVSNVSRNESAQSESPGEDEIVVVDDYQRDSPAEVKAEPAEGFTFVPSLSVEEALSRLPPIDKAHLRDYEDEHPCTCSLSENEEGEGEESAAKENPECPARSHLEKRYRLRDITRERIESLHADCADQVNGNFGINSEPKREEPDEAESVVNIVPNFYELPPKRADSDSRDSVCENYKKYSISDRDLDVEFREYHRVLDRPSYNGDVLRILPYVVID